MARRADHSRGQLKEMAVSAALGIVQQEGFNALSARKVAASIGYTVGTLYNVFADFDDLVLHMNARTLDDWYAMLEAGLKKSRSKEPLQVLAKLYLQFSEQRTHEWLALFDHQMQGQVPKWYAPLMLRFFTLTESLILPQVKDNQQKAADIARVLWSGIHGICILHHSGKLALVGSQTPEKLAIILVDNVLLSIDK